MKIERTLQAIPTMSDEASAGVRANVERLLAHGSKAQKAAAEEVLEALEARVVDQAAARAARVAELSPVERIVGAFRKQPIKETERKVIQVLLDNPGATSPILTKKAGWTGKTAWHLRFGTMCKAREENLWPAEPAVTRSGDFYTGILADYCPETHGFTLKPEALLAFAMLGLLPAPATTGTPADDPAAG
jgi:hypothetical protein